MNGRRSYTRITWLDYVKCVQNLEKYKNDFSHWVEIQVVEPRDHLLCYWKVDKWVWLYEVSKYIGRLKIRLKIIKYKEKFFYYLFFYKILFFRA